MRVEELAQRFHFGQFGHGSTLPQGRRGRAPGRLRLCDVRVLLVEDDEDLRFGVAAALRAAGLAVDEAADLPGADEALFVTAYDCAVFDRMLPSGDAAAYVEELRRGGRDVPVLFLTARDTVADRVEGFASGGDDYLVKPFAVPELVARVRSLCRRSAVVRPPVHRVGDLEVDTARRRRPPGRGAAVPHHQGVRRP